MAARRRRPKAEEAKLGIMGFGLMLTGVIEFVEGVQAGDDVITAGTKAVKRTKIRGQAIKKAAKSAARELAKEDDS